MAALTDSLPASLVFLTDAAHLLAASSPETSAHLMARRNALMAGTGLVVSDTQRQHACTACGHIMVPGHGDVLSLDSQRAALRRRTRTRKLVVSNNNSCGKGRSSSPRDRAKRLECAMCTSYTDIRLPPAPKITRHRHPLVTAASSKTAVVPMAATPAAAPSSAATPEPPKPASVNASSKKRAKS
ncbi:hypothetical protein Micbo1qcDRAFT_154947, partial [Microdochium bolleyi]